jgi:peptide/nickel transport system permease protein
VLRYVAARLGYGLLLLAGISVLSFLLAEMAPGDAVQELRLNPRLSPATVAAIRARYGLDRPLPVRYLRWVRSMAAGELGWSVAYGAPVGPLLWRRAGNTLLLAVTAMALAWLAAVPAGVWSAAHQGGWADRAGLAATAVLLAVSELVLALAGLAVAARTGLLPAGGMASLDYDSLGGWERARDLAAHLALPAVVLALSAFPVVLRHVRAAVAEALAAPFVQAARGSGIPHRRLLWRHALPAAAKPLVSLFGLSIAGLLSGSVLVEVVLSWPGLGPLLLQAILARDLHVVVGVLLLSSVFLIFGNLVADLLLYGLDPRVRA